MYNAWEIAMSALLPEHELYENFFFFLIWLESNTESNDKLEQINLLQHVAKQSLYCKRFKEK